MKFLIIVLLLNVMFNYDVIKCDAIEDALDLVNSIEMQRLSEDQNQDSIFDDDRYVNIPNEHPISFDEGRNEMVSDSGVLGQNLQQSELNKRFYVQVIRRYCSRSESCLGIKGRHRYPTCTCVGNKKCRRVMGGYRCY